MSRPAVIGLVLSIAIVVVAVAVAFAASPEGIADKLFEHPNDDPQFFCSTPDPSPVAEAAGASLILQACDAARTRNLPRGETVAIDLASGGNLDSGADFHALSVSDGSILQSVIAPETIGRGLVDYFAVYRGIRSGSVTVSALYRTCLNGKCVDTFRWEANVQVS